MELRAIVRAVLMFFDRMSGRVYRVRVQIAAQHLLAPVYFIFSSLLHSRPKYLSQTRLSIRCSNLRVVRVINASETGSVKFASPRLANEHGAKASPKLDRHIKVVAPRK